MKIKREKYKSQRGLEEQIENTKKKDTTKKKTKQIENMKIKKSQGKFEEQKDYNR